MKGEKLCEGDGGTGTGMMDSNEGINERDEEQVRGEK
jgi:hypothetical protein